MMEWLIFFRLCTTTLINWLGHWEELDGLYSPAHVNLPTRNNKFSTFAQFTCEVECDIGIRFAEFVDGIASILTAVFLGWCTDSECQCILISGGLFSRHLIAWRRFFDPKVSSKPPNLRRGVALDYAFHNQKHLFAYWILILTDCRLLWKSWRSSGWDSKNSNLFPLEKFANFQIQLKF